MQADHAHRLLRRHEATAPLAAAGFDPDRDEDLDRAARRLLRRFREGDDVEAYALLVELTHERLVRLASRLTRRLAMVLDPEDLASRFLVRLFEDVRRDQPHVRRFLGMAYTAMRFDALNELRLWQRARDRGAVFESLLVSRRPSGDPAVVLAEREGLATLRRASTVLLGVVASCFHGLRDRDRRVLYLREVDGLSYDDLAERLAVPRSQVGMVLKRARGRLARRIEQSLAAHAPVPTQPQTCEGRT